MTSQRLFLVAAACALPLSTAACGGGSSDEVIIPKGTHHQYVVSSVSIPANDIEARQFGLDLGTKTSSKLDGNPDNTIGSALAVLASFNFKIQDTLTTAVDHGSIILLVDVQTEDFTNASATGFAVKLGEKPVPAACDSPTDPVCRHHLTGSGMFTVSASSPADAEVAGKIVNSTFNGGPGDITLQIAIGSTDPISLNLLHARVKATQISDTGIMTANVGGLVVQTDLTTQIGPAIAAQVKAIQMRDCTGPNPTVPPKCGCPDGTTGALVLTQLDGDLLLSGGPAADCNVTVDEVLGYGVVKTLLQPDSCSMSSCPKADSLSIGVKVQAVKATF